MCILKSSTAMTFVRRRQPLVVPVPPPSNTISSNKTMTLFWCTVSLASSFACLTSLTNMACFNTLTHPYTNPIIFLASVISVSLHLALFFNLGRIPTLDDLSLRRIHCFVGSSGYFIKSLAMVYPREDSVEVVVFFVALAVDVLAILELVKPRKEADLFNHALFVAMLRTCRMCFFQGRNEFWYLYGALMALSYYHHFYRKSFKEKKD